MFLHLSGCLQGAGEGSASVHAGIPPPSPPGAGTPGSRHPQTGTPLEQTPPRADTLPGRWLRILLECILVNIALFNLRYLAGNCTFLYKKYFSKIYLHQYSESYFYWIAGPFGLVEKMTISLTMSPGHMPKNPYLQSCGGIPMDLNITKEIVSTLRFPNTNWMFITVINTCIMFVKSNMHWNNATY